LKKKNKKNKQEEENDWRREDDDNTFYSVDNAERTGDTGKSTRSLEESADLHKTGVH
jgi:hypothetical protein